MKSKVFQFAALALTLALVFGSMPVFAASHGEKVRLAGTVMSIDDKGKSFTISDRNSETNKIFVNTGTEIELNNGKHFFHDDDVSFSAIKVGDWVKIKSHRINNQLEASWIEIHRR